MGVPSIQTRARGHFHMQPLQPKSAPMLDNLSKFRVNVTHPKTIDGKSRTEREVHTLVVR